MGRSLFGDIANVVGDAAGCTGTSVKSGHSRPQPLQPRFGSTVLSPSVIHDFAYFFKYTTLQFAA